MNCSAVLHGAGTKNGTMNVVTALLLCCSVASVAGCTASPAGDENVELVSAAQTISIGETVTSASGPIAGATIRVMGTAQASTLSDASGNYTLSVNSGSYQISAGGLANCTFSPSSANLNNLNANATQNFVGNGTGCASAGSSGFVSRAFFTQASDEPVLPRNSRRS